MSAFARSKLASLSAVLCFCLLVCAGCGPEWESDPDVERARVACAGLRRREHTTCVLWEAVARQNPYVCHLSGLGLDSVCLREVYQTAADPAVCDRVYVNSTAAECRSWYAEHQTESGGPGDGSNELDRRQPRGDFLEACATTTIRELAGFRQALGTGEQAFGPICKQLGQPDWITGSGLIIFIYELADGSEVWLGFAGLQELSYAIQVTPGGEKIDLLGK
jgi:hypothetical protein